MALSLELEKQIAAAQAAAEEFQEVIRKQKENLADTTLVAYAATIDALPRNSMKVRRILQGHASKVYSVSWSHDSEKLLSASQDGKLIVWDPLTTDKLYGINLKSNWVMTCAYSPTSRFVASGGLDNICTIYDMDKVAESLAASSEGIPDIRPKRELFGHIGFISSCTFLNDNEIITTSGDTTALLWDIEAAKPTLSFKGHTGDVTSLGLVANRWEPGSATTFITGSCDGTARMWDLRNGQCVRIYVGHDNDINALDVFPDGNAICTGSEDCTARLYDLRADREMNRFQEKSHKSAVTSVYFSRSGRGIFASYDDSTMELWDALKAEKCGIYAAGDDRVSCLRVSPNGNALATAGWDCEVRIWA